MQELLALHASKIKGFKRGEKIQAKVIEIGKKSVTFDVNGKSEGILKDIYFQEARDFMKTLKSGDTVNATVMDPETSDGHVLLSLRHAASDSLWDRLNQIKEANSPITVKVRNSNQSGISVDFEGISGFIPTSQIGKNLLMNIDNAPEVIKVKIIEINKEKRKVVFSEKEVSEEKEIKDIEKAMKNIKVDEIYEGEIVKLTNFGAFVKINVKKLDVEGLVHVSEISWDKVNKPNDTMKVGDKVKVKVIGTKDKEHEDKLSLSIKQAQDDPWKNIENEFKIDDKVKGTISRNSDFGTFVKIASGIEGLIHMTKIPPAMKLNIGDEVNCYIEEIDPKNKKISLGLVLTSKPVAYK